MWPKDKRFHVESAAPIANPHCYPSRSPIAFLRMERTRRRFVLFLLPVLALFLLLHHHVILFPRGTFSGFDILNLEPSEESAVLENVNATLGFGAVVAVSHATSPRREGLLWAANLTGVDIVIPEQPRWAESDLAKFKAKSGSKIDQGSALAWMGHLNALTWFLSSPLQTALILEDDVDFSLHLLPQIDLASRAMRTLLSPSSPSNTPNITLNTDPSFWAPPSAWDILWLGHCGDAASPEHILSHSALTYPDPHVLPLPSLHPPTTLLHTLSLPSTRLLHRSHWPLCTFGYGVTRTSALRILSAYSTEGENGCVAFDVRMLEACRDHSDTWRCWTVVPEVFHHGRGGSEIHRVSSSLTDTTSPSSSGGENESEDAVNIECGARNRGLWVDSRETEKRRWMLDTVRKARKSTACVIDAVKQESSNLAI